MVATMVLETIGGPLVPREEGAAADDSLAPGEVLPGEVLIEHQAIGVNFVDLYHRDGLYPLPAGLPAILGVEAAGVVLAVGAGVEGWRSGDRVAYALPPGAYSSRRRIAASRLLALPPGLTAEKAAAGLLKGLTAWMLLRDVLRLTAGDSLLVHGAAGGVGQILCRMAKADGLRVIGTVGSAAKAELARAAGADEIILYREEDFVARTLALTGGEGVAAAVDGLGGEILARTLDCVRIFGSVASIGQAAGSIPPLDVFAIGPRRALSLSRPSVFAYSAQTERYQAAGREVLALLAGDFPIAIGGTYPLAQVNEALSALSAGKTSGSLVLLP